MSGEIPDASADRRLKLGLLMAAAALMAASTLAAISGRIRSDLGAGGLPEFFYLNQDRWLILVIALALLTIAYAGRLTPPRALFEAMRALVRPKGAAVLIIAMGVIAFSGRFLLLGDYDLTRDEQLANFDAFIFRNGALHWPFPEEWRQSYEALNTLFMAQRGDAAYWVSGYLPVNAGVRALFGAIALSDLVNPALLMIGAAALWRIVRRLAPGDDAALAASLLLYAGSGQALYIAMTSYAMTGYLALNLVWLWFFLQGRRMCDVAALAVGFFATGLHQPVFHPLFAFPILATLVIRREWMRAALYFAGYLGIANVWLAWPEFIASLDSAAPPAAMASPIILLRMMLAEFDPETGRLMSFNLLRFFAWQHALLAPLIALGAAAALRERNLLMASFVAVILLPIIAAIFLLPNQGHGWGYRYLHGVIGPAILLAIFGLRAFKISDASRWRLLGLGSIATFAILLPMQGAMMRTLYKTNSDIDAAIAASGADYAIIDPDGAPYALDFVLNAPDLANRPLRLNSEKLHDRDVVRICAKGANVVMVGAPALASLNRLFAPDEIKQGEIYRTLEPRLQGAGCAVSTLAQPG